MRVILFCHSLVSDWNHGNAHFLRGICSDLLARGHAVDVYEPADAWSVANLVAEHGTAALDAFRSAYPQLHSTRYQPAALDLDAVLAEADLVLVHEWNEHALVQRIGQHHYDGVLAFGSVPGPLAPAVPPVQVADDIRCWRWICWPGAPVG